MANSVFKKIQVVGTSPTSFVEATANAVAKLAQSEKNLSWFEVAELRGAIRDGRVHEYQVTLNVGAKMEQGS
jgi:flavin-binding protein dodecin